MTALRLLVGYALAFVGFAFMLLAGVQAPLAILGVLLGFLGITDAIIGWIANTLLFGIVGTIVWVIARLVLPARELDL